MNKSMWSASLFSVAVALVGCDRTTSVDKEVQDLKAAQQNSPNVANDLNQQLNKAKSEVVTLEEKLALAKQGVTDEVVEERNDVKEALKVQEQEVREEVQEAQGAAHQHSADSQKALQHLEKSQPTQHVQAEVKTEMHAVPTGTRVEVTKEQHQVPLENTRVIEHTTAAPAAEPKAPNAMR